MKQAHFTHTHDRTGRKTFGMVTLKDDGKVSISLPGFQGSSYERSQAKITANAIVAADFNHPAVYNLTVSNAKNLANQLTEQTQSFKATYIERVKAAAKRMYANSIEVMSMTRAEWIEKYGYKSEYVYNYTTRMRELKEYKNELSKRGAQIVSEARMVTGMGLEAYEASEVKYAENHYRNSIDKLAHRLTAKGVKDDSSVKVSVNHIDVNLDVFVNYEGGSVHAYTIIAEGPIQRAHYRFLIK